jgi:peptidyl-prolyl cis-trans isomerase SurA
MKIATLFLAVCAISFAAVPVHAANTQGIAVIVNQDAITQSNVNDRMKLIATSTGMPDTKELMDKLRPQVVDMLVEEQIKLQEAKRLKLNVTQEEINGGFTQIAQQNNIPPEEFKKMLKARNIRIGTMEDQIRSQIAWGKVVQKRVRPQIEVSDADIDSQLEQLRSKIGKTEYRLANIYLPFNEEKKQSEVSEFANKIVSQLRQKPDLFPRIAIQFSQAPGAAQGGLMGWVSEGELAPELDDKLKTLAVNEASEPIKTLSGYYILLVREKRQMTEENLPSREDLTERIGTERLDRGQRRYLMDLRSSAYIESRV